MLIYNGAAGEKYGLVLILYGRFRPPLYERKIDLGTMLVCSIHDRYRLDNQIGYQTSAVSVKNIGTSYWQSISEKIAAKL